MPRIGVESGLHGSSMNEMLRESAMQEVLKERAISGKKMSGMDLIREIGKKFIEKQIDNFPMMCDVARYQNRMKQRELEVTGRKGRYTDSLGWSETYEFKHEYEIPQELHLFMINLVYKDFWSTENQKVWRRFMWRILHNGGAHEDMETLMWAKGIYGSNSQKTLVTTS